jgi:hypothetical protein
MRMMDDLLMGRKEILERVTLDTLLTFIDKSSKDFIRDVS